VVPSKPPQPDLDDFGENLPLQGRKQFLEETFELFQKVVDSQTAGRQPNEPFTFPIATGTKGIGKTKSISAIVKHISENILKLSFSYDPKTKEQKKPLPKVVHLSLNFGNGMSPANDTNLPAATFLFFRIYFAYFLKPQGKKFGELVTYMNTIEVVGPVSVFFLLSKIQEIENAEVIFILTMDEVQNLIQGGIFGKICDEIKSPYFDPPRNSRLLLYMVGTLTTPLQNHVRTSGLKCRNCYLPLLTPDQITKIIEFVFPDPHPWKTWGPFLRLISFVGSHPRSLALCLKKYQEEIKKGIFFMGINPEKILDEIRPEF